MRILLTGATGLVGQGVLRECLHDAKVEQVISLGRKPSGQTHAKLTDVMVNDFSDLAAVEDRLYPVDACFYCAGALPAGLPEAEFRHVTFDLTLQVARTLAKLNPAMRLLYVSGAHAKRNSIVMPLRIKAETEEALAALPVQTIMLRPGGVQPLHGVQSPHSGMSAVYAVAGPLMGLGARFLPSLFTTTEALGRAMLKLARDPHPPAIVENARINELGA